MVDKLRSLAQIDSVDSNPRKCLREKEMVKSEDRVRRMVTVLKDDFLDPFSDAMDQSRLFNLASGRPLPLEISNEILTTESRGKVMFLEFSKRLDASAVEQLEFFDPIKKAPWRGFDKINKKVCVSSKGKTRDLAVQRDILGVLMAESYKENKSIDIDKALCFPLAPVPLSMATGDGIRRKTAKSSLLDAALSSVIAENDVVDNVTCYVVDLVAAIRCINKIPDTFRQLAVKLRQDLPRKYSKFYVACDSYTERSIKGCERRLRGQSERFVIRNPDIRTPPDFKNFMNNGVNKERLFELIEEVWIENAYDLGDKVIFFARKNVCVKMSREGTERVLDLQTNHEEADTKVCCLLHHAHQHNEGEETNCILRSHSGDTDIPIILLANEVPNMHVYVDNGAGKHRKLLDLASCGLSYEQKQALLGLHAFSGNDYVSSFMRKGKKVCWNLVKENPEFLTAFIEIGLEMRASESLLHSLERFICRLYGEKRLTSVNEVRKKVFWKNYSRENRITDLSLLPPCQSSLFLHIKRANYVARIWRQASTPIMEIEDPKHHGWQEDLTEEWVTVPFPEDITELLVDMTEEELEAGVAEAEDKADFSDDDEDD